MLSLFALRSEDGSAYATCGIATDISERKRAEVALEVRQGVLDTILAACPDIISLIDAKGRIRHVSAAEQSMLRHRHRDPRSSELFSLVHPDDFDHVASAFIGMVTGSRSQLHVRYRVQHADGRWITVDSRAQAVVDEDGRFVGAVVVTRDVSAQLDSETRLRELRQAADKASRAKSEFLSRMSHELRTPLNAILGFSQLLQMDDLSLPQAEAVEHILRAGRQLLELIDDVLDIARIETGHLELAIRAVLVADVVTEVAVQSGIDAEEPLAVLADRQRLLQVVSHLVSNAVKYNRPGGRVDVSCDALPDGRVRLAVADTGRGIRPEDLGRVFEPFDRLGAEQSGVAGTGVGLALARSLVERMNGTITVESVPDVGSTFSVELPMAVISEEGRSGAARRSLGDGTHRTAGFRVLLVEEDLSSRELVERVLARRPGVTVLVARDGSSALAAAREHRPDLILVDLQLPDMSGSALLDELGQDALCASIPVAVLGAEVGSGQVRRLLGRGVAGQLTKPIDVRALLSLVDAARAASGK
jgi:PAS domain S-box-containing protein